MTQTAWEGNTLYWHQYNGGSKLIPPNSYSSSKFSSPDIRSVSSWCQGLTKNCFYKTKQYFPSKNWGKEASIQSLTPFTDPFLPSVTPAIGLCQPTAPTAYFLVHSVSACGPSPLLHRVFLKRRALPGWALHGPESRQFLGSFQPSSKVAWCPPTCCNSPLIPFSNHFPYPCSHYLPVAYVPQVSCPSLPTLAPPFFILCSALTSPEASPVWTLSPHSQLANPCLAPINTSGPGSEPLSDPHRISWFFAD